MSRRLNALGATRPRTARRLLELMRAILRDPFSGIGKPEPLKHLGAGVWSRRITQEHRCVYQVSDGRVHFIRAVITTDLRKKTRTRGHLQALQAPL